MQPIYSASEKPIMSSDSSLIWPGFNRQVANEDHEEGPATKRRKGVASTILSTALDAALLTSAVGYAAYQFWFGKGIKDEAEDRSRILNNCLSRSSPPPPYQPRDPQSRPNRPQLKRPPIQSQNRLRTQQSQQISTTTRHPSRSTPFQRKTSLSSSNFVLRAPLEAHGRNNRTKDLTCSCRTSYEQNQRSINERTCKYHEMKNKGAREELEEDEDDDEDDNEQMKAFKAQIKGLIQDGQAALASRPDCVEIENDNQFRTQTQNRVTDSNNHQTDENVKILQSALEQAASSSKKNWWEQ
ncbi:hypothetical protein BY996DRAFT_6655214 [Phakopsora pachyrhizi]|nr:hypothetical protein BY996DRAFT_6655214 [Phakopsora pachyrhizi]